MYASLEELQGQRPICVFIFEILLLLIVVPVSHNKEINIRQVYELPKYVYMNE